MHGRSRRESVRQRHEELDRRLDVMGGQASIGLVELHQCRHLRMLDGKVLIIEHHRVNAVLECGRDHALSSESLRSFQRRLHSVAQPREHEYSIVLAVLDLPAWHVSPRNLLQTCTKMIRRRLELVVIALEDDLIS